MGGDCGRGSYSHSNDHPHNLLHCIQHESVSVVVCTYSIHVLCMYSLVPQAPPPKQYRKDVIFGVEPGNGALILLEVPKQQTCTYEVFIQC